MSQLLDITVHAERGAPVQRLTRAPVHATGVTGDVPRVKEHRQVAVVAREAWDKACAELGAPVPWTARRANFLIDGIDLKETTGKRLRIGPVLLEITGETKPCGEMDRQHPGLQAALKPDWRAGVICHVLETGEVKIGDAVELI